MLLLIIAPGVAVVDGQVEGASRRRAAPDGLVSWHLLRMCPECWDAFKPKVRPD